MRVTVDEREYTLYVSHTSADGKVQRWTMNTFDLTRNNAWIDTQHDVSNVNPFESSVTYNFWR